MDKKKFLNLFYDTFRRDVVAGVDTLLSVQDRIKPSDSDVPYFDVARSLVLRPDLFQNIRFCCTFLLEMSRKYDCVPYLLDFNPKLSPNFMAHLLTFDFICYECKENN